MRKYLVTALLVLMLLFILLVGCKKTSTTEFTVDRSDCIGCGRCQQVCPADAIELDHNGKAVIDQTLCVQDGACVRVCPQNAIY